MLRDWDRGADGQLEALRQGMERLPVPSAAGSEGQGGAGAAGSGASDEIELFVEADGISEEGEEGGPQKEDKDLLKHRVWFWQVRSSLGCGQCEIHPGRQAEGSVFFLAGQVCFIAHQHARTRKAVVVLISPV